MTKEEMRVRIIEILTDNAIVNNTKTSTAILEDQYPFIADEILGCFSEVVSPAEPKCERCGKPIFQIRFCGECNIKIMQRSKAGSGGTPV